MKRHFILLGMLAVLAACNEQTVRKEGFGVHGIDVSHYQKQVDWQKVAAQDVHFAFVKASEGQSMQDTVFCKNWDAMRSAGILRGAYHFFRPSVSAELQARNFLSIIDLQHGDLPPVLDVEVTDGYSAEQVAQGVKTWLKLVEAAYLVKPVIYSNQKFYNQYLAKQLSGYPVWVARYTNIWSPEIADGNSWSFWQYGNRGRLHGIAGDVDFNVFNGSLADLESLTICRPAPLLDKIPDIPTIPKAAQPAPPETHALPGEPVAANP
ncbi:MAG: glycoside hydrolase family 25 protein [Bacteroidetes bacterium]|nr:glycoside hydrolase family 25 protein [Bacteroidota bacterium]